LRINLIKSPKTRFSLDINPLSEEAMETESFDNASEEMADEICIKEDNLSEVFYF